MPKRENFVTIIAELDSIREDLNKQDITVGPLDDAISKLRCHIGNVEAIEKNITAIQAEVIEPITDQLNEHKKAGKFSVLGFYVGGLGVLFSVLIFFYTTILSEDKSKDLTVELSNKSEELVKVHSELTKLKGDSKLEKNAYFENEVSLLLFRSISRLLLERKGSVDKLIKILKHENHIDQRNILHFYLAHLPNLLKNRNDSAVLSSTLLLSKLEPEVLKEEKSQIENFYKKIYRKKEWDQTSSYYEELAEKAQIFLDSN